MLDPFLPSIRIALCKLNKEKEFEFIEYLLRIWKRLASISSISRSISINNSLNKTFTSILFLIVFISNQIKLIRTNDDWFVTRDDHRTSFSVLYCPDVLSCLFYLSCQSCTVLYGLKILCLVLSCRTGQDVLQDKYSFTCLP